MGKLLNILFSIFLLVNISYGQDYAFLASEPVISDFKELKNKLAPNHLENLQAAFLNHDNEKIASFFHKSIDRSEIMEVLEVSKKRMEIEKFDNLYSYNGEITKAEKPLVWEGYKHKGVFHFIKNGQLKECRFEFFFIVKDFKIAINRMMIVYDRKNLFFPKFLPEYEKLVFEVNYRASMNGYEKVMEMESKLTERKEFFIDAEVTTSELYDTNVATLYGNLAWHLLTTKKYEKGKESAQKALKIDRKEKWINKNLALNYLFLDEYKKAKNIYLNNSEIIYKAQPLKTQFLKDLDYLEGEGIYHPDFEKIRKLFLEKK